MDARVRFSAKLAAFENLPMGMAGATIAALSVTWVLWPRLPHNDLLVWLAARLLIAFIRWRHARLVLCSAQPLDASTMRHHVTLAVVDGILWGALGWALTPLYNLEVSVVTISMLCTIGCIGALVMSVDLPAALGFTAPMILPNALYAGLGRPDDLGFFCAVAVLGLGLMLAVAARANNRRVLELMRLRIESDMARQAQTQALEEARLLSAARSRFIATMSHEMRTPLHGMLGMVGLLQADVRGSGSDRRLDIIQRSGEHLLQVINDVLDFSRSESGGLPLHEEPFSMPRVLQEAADMVRASAAQKGLNLEVQIRLDPDEWVQGDPMRLRQIVLNLLGNAIKFTADGVVRLHALRDPETGWMRVTVSDTGIGIPPADVERIFEPFQQSDGTYERRFGGTGLGLTISRDLCLAMGGRIRCHSEPGQGAAFICEWPLPRVAAPAAATPARHEAASRDPAAPLAGLAVLVVEDNPVNALVLKAMLDQMQMHATVVDHGEAALQWLASHTADLILMDCEMPGIDGMETTRRWRTAERARGGARCPVVALTANGPEVFEAQGRAAGMDAYLAKPFSLHELRHCLLAVRRAPDLANR